MVEKNQMIRAHRTQAPGRMFVTLAIGFDGNPLYLMLTTDVSVIKSPLIDRKVRQVLPASFHGNSQIVRYLVHSARVVVTTKPTSRLSFLRTPFIPSNPGIQLTRLYSIVLMSR